jgi:pilus assembly protein Flp/PilA
MARKPRYYRDSTRFDAVYKGMRRNMYACEKPRKFRSPENAVRKISRGCYRRSRGGAVFDIGPAATYHCRSHARPFSRSEPRLVGVPPDARRQSRLNMLRFIARSFVTFLVDENGPTAVEYAVMLALIIIVCIVAITTLGKNANSTFTTVATKISAS